MSKLQYFLVKFSIFQWHIECARHNGDSTQGTKDFFCDNMCKQHAGVVVRSAGNKRKSKANFAQKGTKSVISIDNCILIFVARVVLELNI